MQRKHALVVGGTGMLADVSLWLNKKGYFVSVIGRRNETYHKLIDKAKKPKQISSILVDYHHTDELKEKLLMAISNEGTFDIIVSWVHSSAPEAIPTILQVQHQNRKSSFDFYHVMSSSAYFEQNQLEIPSNCHYHKIYLGFKEHGRHSRWLTHQEIAEGIKDTIHHKRPQTIVGQVEPWDMRPR